MTTPAFKYSDIVISEENANSGLFAAVLIENKGHIRDEFEKAFNVRLDRRYDNDGGQIKLIFQTTEQNIDMVKQGFDTVLQIMKEKQTTFITSLMVYEASKRIYGHAHPGKDLQKMSHNDKIKAATESFNKNKPKGRDAGRNHGKAANNNNRNNFNRNSSNGGSRDRFNKNGGEAPSAYEVLNELRETFSYKFQARTEKQQILYDTIGTEDLTFALGPAGTGKTHVSIARAIQALVEGKVEKIILSRPIVQNGKDMGALPGDIRAKLGPYMVPLYDELNDVVKSSALTDRLIESGLVEIAPIETARGRTFKKAYIILDEAQNATEEQTLMFLTRFGEGSTMVFAGDADQVDKLPEGTFSGLKPASDLIKGTKGTGYVLFEKKDICRHELVSRIIDALSAGDFAALRQGRKKSGPDLSNN